MTGNGWAPQAWCIDIDLRSLTHRVDITVTVALNVNHMIVHDLGIWLEHGGWNHAKVVRLLNQLICLIDNSISASTPNRLSIVLLAEDGSVGHWR